MVREEKSSHFKARNNENLTVDVSSNVINVRHEQILLSPTSSHSSDYSDNATTSSSYGGIGGDQKAIKKFEDNSETTTSSNDRLDR